ncbi:MAG: KpsF/GutQ family sugar-phosphate isomerase [Firmicutes bacterium]|nr:KpsF/GutQ family sugar-phosphate isomerase [Bacillota bacterium]
MSATPPASEPDATRSTVARTLEAVRSAIEDLEGSWNEAIRKDWTTHVAASKGRVVVSGMGKSGLVGQKIAATLASTGCPSFFMHPAEALHGDLGMVTLDDTVLLLSNSGESEEVLKLIPSLLRMGIPIGAITSRKESRLGQAARWCFTYRLPKGEGCPLQFAPMASTTLQLVWGDLLAAHHMVHTGFSLDRYAQFHPAGNIGSRLLKTEKIMHREFPQAESEAPLVSLLGLMTKGRLGMTTVVEEGRLRGVVSDGDIRRALEKAERNGQNPLTLTASDIMTRNPITVAPDSLAIEAAQTLEARKITFLLVTEGEIPVGVLHIHDLLQAKVI